MSNRSHLPDERGLTHQLSTRREFVIGGAFGVTAILTAAAAPGPASSQASSSVRPLQELVPKRIGEWTVAPFADVFIPQAEKAEEKSYDEVLTRYYESSSAPAVMLLIAYGSAQVGGTELHRPEACYPVAGFKLHRRPNIMLRSSEVPIAARSMTAVGTDRIEQLIYWTRVGKEFPTSSLSQRWSAVRQTLRGSIPDGVLVRMSTLGPDSGPAVVVLQKFGKELLSAGGPALRLMLTGRA